MNRFTYKNIGDNRSHICLAAVIGAAVALTLWSFGIFAADSRRLQDDVLRLHIIANSDSEADQRLKLELRDYLLQTARFPSEYTKKQTIAAAKSELPQITAKANEFLRSKGVSYTARAEVARMYFNTRRYEGFLMPAGQYDALRVTLGDGAGENWWCVLFPPLCLPAAGERTAVSAVEPYVGARVASEMRGVKVKFAVYEWICEVVGEK